MQMSGVDDAKSKTGSNAFASLISLNWIIFGMQLNLIAGDMFIIHLLNCVSRLFMFVCLFVGQQIRTICLKESGIPLVSVFCLRASRGFGGQGSLVCHRGHLSPLLSSIVVEEQSWKKIVLGRGI